MVHLYHIRGGVTHGCIPDWARLAELRSVMGALADEWLTRQPHDEWLVAARLREWQREIEATPSPSVS